MVDLCDDLSIPAEQVLDFCTNDCVHHTDYFAQAWTLDFIRESLRTTPR